MKIRILGSGTSTGAPQIGCTCPVCTSADPKDNRLRTSAIVETGDALRPFCRFGSVPIYAEQYVSDALRLRMPYCFVDHRYPGVPDIPLQEISVGQKFFINTTEVMPLRVMHGRLPILGYRIGQLGYITDMLTIPEESYEQLAGIDVLIVNALRIAPHPTHQDLEEALAVAQRIRAKKTYFIHMSHDMGLHAEVERKLPENIHLAYDGLEILL